jgi:hypothetical protein
VRVYIAAPWARKPEAIAVGELFKAAGHTVTSRWFAHPGSLADSTGTSYPIEEIRLQASEDIADVLSSEVLVVLNLQKSEGKACETGVALMAQIPVISVGPRLHIFQSLGTEVETVEAALAVVNSLRP